MNNIMLRKYIVYVILILLISISISSVIGKIEDNNTVIIEYQNHNYKNTFIDSIFDKLLSYYMDYGHFPSLSACILKSDEVIWDGSYGFYDLENSKQATTDTIYMVASISKTITGTALMQLFDQDLFDLDDDVNDFLPFNLRNPNFPDDIITFRMILSHASSLSLDSSMSHYWWANWSGDPPISWYPYPWLEDYLIPGGKWYDSIIWSEENRPGERMMYANINFDIAAYLVEFISGQSFNDYCKDNIFTPLDMFNTSFSLTDLDIENAALPYHYQTSGTHKRYDHHKILHYPAAGLRTSINDLSHFLIVHMNGGVYNGVRILDEETVDMMHMIQSEIENYIWYGLGWRIWKTYGIERFSGHTGDFTPGFSTTMKIRIRDNNGIIFFVNADRMQNNQEDGNKAVSMIQKILFLKATLS
jgi:CubicO group peptidase (beta-lactamase class C family)